GSREPTFLIQSVKALHILLCHERPVHSHAAGTDSARPRKRMRRCFSLESQSADKLLDRFLVAIKGLAIHLRLCVVNVVTTGSKSVERNAFVGTYDCNGMTVWYVREVWAALIKVIWCCI